ncbi:unnamed protein product [Protopolystoma xenopodis]|uniref:Uncharacterized protein n=1 Tax=Protopolystoma xenopodis TaxID=117903 RepID=A0A448X135_9PLAT|nr:unnamed protein product [Protopolystoma xenopodis]
MPRAPQTSGVASFAWPACTRDLQTEAQKPILPVPSGAHPRMECEPIENTPPPLGDMFVGPGECILKKSKCALFLLPVQRWGVEEVITENRTICVCFGEKIWYTLWVGCSRLLVVHIPELPEGST